MALGVDRSFSHAEAPIDAERHGQRKLAGSERRNLLRAVVFEHLEVGLTKPRDQLPLRIGDRRVDLNELNAGGKLRKHARIRHPGA